MIGQFRWLTALKVAGFSLSAVIVTVLVTIVGLWIYAGGQKLPPDQITWGVTFSNVAAREFEIDLDQAYLAILNDLQPKRLRLVAYWNELEPQPDRYDYARLDFQVREAENRGIPYILAIGRRVPRYPECFVPDWAKPQSETAQQAHIKDYLTNLVNRYKHNPHLHGWQVENEPFLDGFFGQCPPLNVPFLEQEVALVRSLSDRPILLTASGELSLWLGVSRLGDSIGTTLYRRALTPQGQLVTQHVPAELYTRRANLARKLHPRVKSTIIAELQAEPWGNRPLIHDDQAFYDRTLSLEQLKHNTEFAASTGLSEIYFWGAEFWYYQKQQGDSRYWDYAKSVFTRSPR